jgi:formylmethanofuran dehydrogenase subunit E
MRVPERDSQADLTPGWYFFAWAGGASTTPVFQVLDTESSLGPYATHTKAITMKDLVKYHGHLCDGLVVASMALQAGLSWLYPEGVIDRTDTGVMTNNSPCFGDAAAYLSGGRIRFGTQKINPDLKIEFILCRFSTRKAVDVALKPDVFPTDVAEIEARIRAGDFSPEDIDECQRRQWDFARHVLDTPPQELFTVRWLPDFEWTPDAYPSCGPRGDVVCKEVARVR